MGTLKTTNIQTITGSGTLTLGTSGETLALGSGVTSNLMYPAFEAYVSSNQTLSDNVLTKVEFDTEVYDTDSAYDNSTNYRYTVPTGKGGKYCVYTNVQVRTTLNSDLKNVHGYIYKNGSVEIYQRHDLVNNPVTRLSSTINVVISLAAGDYIEVFVKGDTASGTPSVEASTHSSYFGAYRIGT